MSSPVIEPLPSSYQYGYVVGRVLRSMADTSEDVDDKPQARAAAGKVSFKPTETLRKVADDGSGLGGAFITSGTETANLSASGRVLDGEGRQGIWLVEGDYLVSFALTDVAGQGITPFSITVTAAHTALAPLDLAVAAPYTPPAGVTVVTYTVPGGGTTGQVLAKTGPTSGAVAWVDAPGGAVDSVNGATGVVVLAASDVGAATTAQGVKADSALQSYTQTLANAAAGSLFVCPLDGSSSAVAGLARPSARTDIFFIWRRTGGVAPTNAITGDQVLYES